MKTIEDSAKDACEGYDDQAYAAGLYMGYKEGAEKQKQIDIDKACEWLFLRSEYPFSSEIISGFRKFMMEE